MYVFKGNYSSGIRYAVGDVVTYIDDKAYHLQKDAGAAGVPPTNTLYWGQLDSDASELCFMLGQVSNKLAADIDTTEESVDDLAGDVTSLQTDVTALQAQVGDKAIVLGSSTEGSTKQFLITVDDTGELLATEVTEGGDA